MEVEEFFEFLFVGLIGKCGDCPLMIPDFTFNDTMNKMSSIMNTPYKILNETREKNYLKGKPFEKLKLNKAAFKF